MDERIENSSRRRSREVTKPSMKTKIKRNKTAMFLAIFIVFILVFSGIYVIFSSLNTRNNDNYDSDYPVAVFDTTMGTIAIELYTDKVPITANNFIDLAKSGFYDKTKFHRISPNFMIQGGDPNSKDNNPSNDGQGGPGYTIDDEFHPDLKNERGMISMANSGPDTGGSQFFILVTDASWLDNAHAVFGKVIDGMNVVDNVANAEHGGEFEPSPGGGIPKEDIIVNSIRIVNES